MVLDYKATSFQKWFWTIFCLSSASMVACYSVCYISSEKGCPNFYNGFCSEIKLCAGPISPSFLGPQNVANESLSLSEFTVARCSMLRYVPFVIICHIRGHMSITYTHR